MHSRGEVFRGFINTLLVSELLSKEDLVELLDEFDGVEGVIEQSFFISAYEELGRHLAKNNDIRNVCLFFEKNKGAIRYEMEEFYYFVESIVDFKSANKQPYDCVYSFIPESYKLHLNRIFR